jgi:agmatine deiminase
MPGEFEPHAGCWLTWPERPDVWRNGAKPAQTAYTAVATAIAQFEPVTVAVSAAQFRHARMRLPRHIRVVEISNDDAWMRDSGPSFVVNDQGVVRGVDWEFNAYGGLDEGIYFPWDKDAQMAEKVLEIAGLDRYKAPLVAEGGSIHVDGQGTLLTTSDCLLNPNRNPTMSQADVEQVLGDYLSVDKVIWLHCEVEGDETNGHVDQLCCFARPGEIVLAWTDDPDNIYYDVVREAYETLMRTPDAQGRTFKIYKLPLAEPMFLTKEEAEGIEINDIAYRREAGMPLVDTYINFYIANGGIVVPTFNQPKCDNLALETLSEAFPDRKIVGVPSREIGIGGGLIHCITQQQPLARSA